MGIYVWGTGCGAGELFDGELKPEQICAFVDSFPSGAAFLGRPVLRPEELSVEDCELMIISARHAEAIGERCRELGLPREKIWYMKNGQTVRDRNEACTAAASILGEDWVKRHSAPCRIIRQPDYFEPRLEERDLENDYVRLATLELICRELENVPGAAAELGVYKGAFARCINSLLPDRTLYLFDSFEGFSEAEAKQEQQEGTCSEAFVEAHRNTGRERVLSSMPRPEQVICKVGYFPDSLEGLEETFCLVSLDVDFEETTLEGLRYFWPRLAPGGCLFLHDHHAKKLTGVARALRRYEAELGVSLPGVPLCDIGGSLILRKSIF